MPDERIILLLKQSPGTLAVRYRCRSCPGLPRKHRCCGGNSALPRAAKSDVTWPMSTFDDEGLESAASKAREGGSYIKSCQGEPPAQT
ncbi:hypothetical protein TYRP_009210 [Tyrophagus putrescentiae]|nr:hypothetical protein TYRP_009210 [Tyrophagus putrescentiae]